MRLPFFIFVLASGAAHAAGDGKHLFRTNVADRARTVQQANLQSLVHPLAEDAHGHSSVSSLIQVHAHHAKSLARSEEGGFIGRQDADADDDDGEVEDLARDAERSPKPQSEAQAGGSSTPSRISKHDLWAIRDLLLLGKASPLLPNTSAGKAKVEAAATNLAAMLPRIHPVAECRTAVRDAVSLEDKAAACWKCLDLSPQNFTSPYLPHKNGFQNAANTQVNFDADQNHLLGACRESKWPRACSYWSSFHAMGVLADVHGIGDQLMKAISPIIAGGALYCGGCTLHWRYLNKHMLPAELHDVGDLLPY